MARVFPACRYVGNLHNRVPSEYHPKYLVSRLGAVDKSSGFQGPQATHNIHLPGSTTKD